MLWEYFRIMNAYFLSGLGADHRIFHHLKLPNQFTTIYLDWIKPQPHESLVNYASRMAKRINPNEPFILIGLSMGGMVAVEIAKKYQPEKLILLSSVPIRKELPHYYNLLQKWKLHKIVPASLLKSAAILKRFFTAEAPEDKTLLKTLIRETDPEFVRWAMNAILDWENEDVPPCKCWHIHGDKDEILPLRFTTATHILSGGTHMMALNHHEEINKILADILNTENE